MIIDLIENAPLYYSLSDDLKTGLKFLKDEQLSELPVGKQVIKDGSVVLSVNEYDTKPAQDAYLEAHEKNIDIQFILEGEESIGISYRGKSNPSTKYDPEKDIQFFGQEADFFPLSKGKFAVFFPTDLHMPGIQLKEKIKVKKGVIKVKVSEKI